MRMSRLFLFLFLAFPLWLQAQDEAHQPRPAVQARLADKALLLDVINTGQQFVAAGERGIVLTSGDGQQWTQAETVPVQSTLTRLAFVGEQLWAVGHDSTIIHSSDAGRTWSLQNFEPENEEPLFDVHFFDDRNGLAIGAYGLILHTDDGGQSWQQAYMADELTGEAIDWPDVEQRAAVDEDDDDGLEEDDDLYDSAADFDRGCYEFLECHLNALVAVDGQGLMIAAEGGYGFRSEDAGQSWESFRFPYAGSMFGLVAVGSEILAYGLRGHAQLTSDFGRSWRELDTGISSNIMGAAVTGSGQVMLVGNGASILAYDPATDQFTASQNQLGNDYAAVAVRTDGSLIVTGAGGIKNE